MKMKKIGPGKCPKFIYVDLPLSICEISPSSTQNNAHITHTAIVCSFGYCELNTNYILYMF